MNSKEYLEWLDTPTTDQEAKEEMAREFYDEEMFGRRANGLPVVSFEAWLERKQRIADMFNTMSGGSDE